MSRLKILYAIYFVRESKMELWHRRGILKCQYILFHNQTRSRCCGCDSLGKKSKIKTITFEICRNYTQTSSTTECHTKAENRRYCVKGNMYIYFSHFAKTKRFFFLFVIKKRKGKATLIVIHVIL